MLKELLIKLTSLSMYYKTAHWQSKNKVYYGDHTLLDRLSCEAGSRIDQVAEKAIGTGENEDVNLPDILKGVYNEVKEESYNPDENTEFFKCAQVMEEELRQFCEDKENAEGTTCGMRNLLGDIADESEGRSYLLKQRLTCCKKHKN